MEQVQRQALPRFMQERMAALESAGYAVQETCRDNDHHFTAGMGNEQGPSARDCRQGRDRRAAW